MTASQKAYREFLKTDFWKELSARKRAKVGKCERCGSTKRLQSHHIEYPARWEDTTEEQLRVLCRKCHCKEHGITYQQHVWWMIYRDDWKFSAILHRIHCLGNRLVKQESGLRPRDEAFLDNALRLYPPTKKDSCMAFKVATVRETARVMAAHGYLPKGMINSPEIPFEL